MDTNFLVPDDPIIGIVITAVVLLLTLTVIGWLLWAVHKEERS